MKTGKLTCMHLHCKQRGHRGCGLMIVGCITTYAISACHH